MHSWPEALARPWTSIRPAAVRLTGFHSRIPGTIAAFPINRPSCFPGPASFAVPSSKFHNAANPGSLPVSFRVVIVGELYG